MSKNKENKGWKELKKVHWGQNIIVDTQEWGYIDFSPGGRKEVFGGEKLTYEEYLDTQMAIGRNIRGAFFGCVWLNNNILQISTIYMYSILQEDVTNYNTY